MTLNFKKLTKTAVTPTRGSSSAAGYDLYADIEGILQIAPHSTEKIPTNIAMEIPEGFFGGVYARSGLATKKGLRPIQGVGVIDSDYRGNIYVPLHNDTDKVQVIEPHERIAQLIIQPYLQVGFNEVNELNSTERGEGGFGSTGIK